MSVRVLASVIFGLGLSWAAGAQCWGLDVNGRSLFVDPVRGSDSADGLAAEVNGSSGPVKSIKRAVQTAGAGDTVHLAKGVYFESIDLTGRSGEPGRPLIIDGHGAVLNGERPIVPEEWQMVGPGLYRNTSLWAMPLRKQKDWVWRWFMIFDGKVNRMGRCMKGANAPYKKPTELQPGEWTYQEEDDHAFYIKIDPVRSLVESRVAVPWEVNGVSVHGANHDLIIRNVTTTRVINDGYNISPVGEDARIYDVQFQDIAAIECGDDGLSGHDDCSLTINGFYSTQNGTGLCTTGNAVNSRLHLTRNVGWEVFFYESPLKGTVTQVIRDSFIDCGATNAFLVMGGRGAEDHCVVKLQNVFISAAPNVGIKARTIQTGLRAGIEATNLTAHGLSFEIDGLGLEVHDSVIAGGETLGIHVGPNVKWSADRNVYDVGSVALGATVYPTANFEAYQREAGQDLASKRETIDVARLRGGNERVSLSGKPVGVDFAAFKGISTLRLSD